MRIRTRKEGSEDWVEHDLADTFTHWAFGKAIHAFELLGVNRMTLEYTTRLQGNMFAEFIKEDN